MTRFLKTGALAALLVGTAAAQTYTNTLDGGVTQYVASVWNTNTIVVGDTTPDNAMVIFGAGRVTNTTSTIGQGTNANNNIVNVRDSGTWIMSGDLYVGDEGSGNYLEIADSAGVENADAYVGAANGASNNSVVVTGAGARWEVDGQLSIGSGEGNGVSVRSGGTVAVNDLLVSGSNNVFNLENGGTFLIDNDFSAQQTGFNWEAGGHVGLTGVLSGMATTNDFNVINEGRGVTLDGGFWQADSNKLVVGWNSMGELNATNGAWVVVGETATNAFAPGLLVSSTNTAELLVDNGSSVRTDGELNVGDGASAYGVVTITNGSSLTVADIHVAGGTNSAVQLDRGGLLYVTGGFDADAQTNVHWNSGAALAVGGTLTKSNGLSGTERELRLVNGTWTPGGDLTVEGSDNTLLISDGSTVANDDAYVIGTNNSVAVSDAGSIWNNNGILNITNSGNAVIVTNNGRIIAKEINVADGNELTVGPNGTLEITEKFDWLANSTNVNWESGGEISVAGALTGMEATSIINGATTNAATYLAGGRDLRLNGGSWLNGGTNLIVGYLESGSELALTNGATLSNAEGYIGWGAESDHNAVRVGSGSSWTNSGGGLYVGAYWEGTNLAKAGSANTLTVESGGQVLVGEATTASPGLLVASTNGAALTVWGGSATIEDTLYLGTDALTSGSATVTNGGRIAVGDLAIVGGSALNLDNGGTFAIDNDFDVTTTGFNWNKGGGLELTGDLLNMYTTNVGTTAGLLDGGRDLTLDGGTWNGGGNDLIIGATAGGSELIVQSTGTLTSATTYLGYGTNSHGNAATVSFGATWNSGDLYVGYLGSNNTVLVTDGGALDVAGDARIGSDVSGGNEIAARGEDSTLDISGNLTLGGTNGANNRLLVFGGATATVGGDIELHADNSILMGDSSVLSLGSVLTVHSNATLGAVEGRDGVGTIKFGATDATLNFNGPISLGEGIHFEADAGFNNQVNLMGGSLTVLGSNAQQYVNFQTASLTDAAITGYGAFDAFSTVNMANGTINPIGLDSDFAALQITGDFVASNTTYSAQAAAEGNDLLTFSGPSGVGLNGLVANVWVPTAPTNEVAPATYSATILTADNGFLNTDFAATNVVDNLLLYDARIEVNGNDVNVVVEQNNEKFSSSLTFAGTESVRAGFNGMKNAVFTRTKQMRRNLVATAHAIPQEAYLMTTTNAPAGAQGPGDQNTIFDHHVWLQYFNGRGDYDQVGDSYGFSLNNSGITLGADKIYGEALTAGFNYTYTRGDTKTSNADFLDVETYWLGLYGEWVSQSGLYVDTLAAIGFSNYDSTRVEENYRGTAAYEGNEVGGYVDVGQYFYYKNLALSPYVGLHALTMSADAHTEVEENGSQVNVDEVTRSWVESALGLKARHRFDTRWGRFQTTGYGEYTHDFMQDDVFTTLSADGLAPASMAHISPDADVVQAGLGFSWMCTDYMEVGLGYNGRFSEHYEEHTSSLMIDLRF